MKPKFSYRKEGNEYVFYCDGELILLDSMDGIKDCIKITTTNESLAAKLLKEMQRKEDPSDPTTLFHYHVATLLLKQEEEKYTEEISNLCYDVILNDTYLMFRQVAPMRQIFAQHFADALPSYLSALPFHKKLATVLFAQTCHSYMLAYYLLIDVIEQEDQEDCKDAFFEDLLAFFEDFFDTEEEAADFLKKITPVINTYVSYMSFESV